MPSFPRHIHHHVLDDQYVLFDERSAQIRVLNPTASYVCERWLAGAAVSAIAGELSALTGAATETTQRDTATLLRDWSAPGFSLGARDPQPPTSAAEAPAFAFPTARQTSPQQRNGSVRRHYRLLDFAFCVDSDPAITDAIDGLLGHLADDAPGAECCVVDVHRAETSGAWRIDIDAHEVGTCASDDEVVPLVHANTLILAYHHTACLTVLHAAAVGRGGRAILLPAASGSGKSTLTAALVASGLDYYSDDLALLDGTPPRLLPAPTRLGVKQGSWPVLATRLPALATLPTYRRADGRLIRYFLPTGMRRPGYRMPPVEVVALVFPRYVEGTALSFAPVSRAEAFLRFTEAGYDLPSGADPAWLETMVDWMRTIECHALEYGELDEAVEAVRGVLA